MGVQPTWRKQSWDPAALDLLPVPDSPAVSVDPERQDAYDELLGCLTAPQREAFEARLAGLSYSKCAEMLEISVRSVRTREDRAMLQLRKTLTERPHLLAALSDYLTVEDL